MDDDSTVEPVFANVRHNKRIDRVTLRERSKLDGQWTRFCLVHNSEKLANAGYAAFASHTVLVHSRGYHGSDRCDDLRSHVLNVPINSRAETLHRNGLFYNLKARVLPQGVSTNCDQRAQRAGSHPLCPVSSNAC